MFTGRSTKNISQKGFTIIESLVAIMLLVVIFAGGTALYNGANRISQLTSHKLTALEEAVSTIEGAKVFPMDEITIGVTQEDFSFGIKNMLALASEGLGKTVTITEVDEDFDSIVDYLDILVQIRWQEPGLNDVSEVSLSTIRYL